MTDNKELDQLLESFTKSTPETNAILLCEGQSLHIFKFDLQRASRYFADLFQNEMSPSIPSYEMHRDVKLKPLLWVLHRICFPLFFRKQKIPEKEEELIGVYQLLLFLSINEDVMKSFGETIRKELTTSKDLSRLIQLGKIAMHRRHIAMIAICAQQLARILHLVNDVPPREIVLKMEQWIEEDFLFSRILLKAMLDFRFEKDSFDQYVESTLSFK